MYDTWFSVRYYKWILERNFHDLNKGVRGNQVAMYFNYLLGPLSAWFNLFVSIVYIHVFYLSLLTLISMIGLQDF